MNVKITTKSNEETTYKFVRTIEDMVVADNGEKYIVLSCFIGKNIGCMDEHINKKNILKIEIELI